VIDGELPVGHPDAAFRDDCPLVETEQQAVRADLVNVLAAPGGCQQLQAA
jgi:hypothetical protein